MDRRCQGITVMPGIIFLFAIFFAAPALAIDTQREDVRGFIDEVSERHGFDREALERLLDQAEVQQPIIDAISRPAEKVKPWHEYRAIFLTPERVRAGVDFWRSQRIELERISEATGVAPEIIVGIIGVETYFGRITGSHRVLDALTTLAFDYPPRSAFFRKELEQFLLLVREEQVDAETALGSYAGAMGAPQFIPSSYRAYAVDASADGRRDLWSDWSDVIGSVANYFVVHGWRRGEPVFTRVALDAERSGVTAGDNGLDTNDTVAGLRAEGIVFETDPEPDTAVRLLRMEAETGHEYWVGFHNFHVITRYNRSAMYALAVWQLGLEIAREFADATA